MTASRISAVRVALVYPDLLGTYGDSGNATILAQRLRWRGYSVEEVAVRAGATVPATCDLYVFGGGEDLPQHLAATQLGAPGSHPSPIAAGSHPSPIAAGSHPSPIAAGSPPSPSLPPIAPGAPAPSPGSARPLHRAVEGGAAVLAVCAGLQILGTSFVGPGGVEAEGLGLLDCRTTRGSGRRAVGELVVDPDPVDRLPVLTGYENHGGITTVGPSARPAGRVRSGVGNGDGSGVDGAVAGRVYGTYLHGPVLARNPALADLLLSWVLGPLPPLDAGIDSESDELRRERLAAAPSEASRGALWTRRGRRWPRPLCSSRCI